jgi:hypothetical protein
MVAGVPFAGVKLPGSDVDHSPPLTAKGKNEWSYNSTPPIRHPGVNSDNFTYFNIRMIKMMHYSKGFCFGKKANKNISKRCSLRDDTRCIFSTMHLNTNF